MEFTHKSYQPGETIAAIATPLGEGGVAIIRISGNEAMEVGAAVFSGPLKEYKSHTAHFGFILDGERKKIDEALALVMRGHRSYTGEDTVELQCHGGMIVSKKVLEAVFKAGARPAHPGEFTFKAFMNGKLDLAQAEAVTQLIHAKNERALSLASDLLEGSLSKRVKEFQKQITTIAAIFEAWVDFPEEGLEFASTEEICEELEEIVKKMRGLVATFEDGKKISEGIHLCIVGAPNVGKSSLMNALLEKERAIVTPHAGTTRDLLEEEYRLNGLHFRLIDTAGIRETYDPIEKEGIRRTKRALEKADLILLLKDASQAQEQEVEEILEEKTILVWNKIDIARGPLPPLGFRHEVKISVKERRGLEELKQKIEEVIWLKGAPPKEELLLSSLRHKEALAAAMEACEKAQRELQKGKSPEFLAFELRRALLELGTILGTNVTEEILSSIFSQFCIGK